MNLQANYYNDLYFYKISTTNTKNYNLLFLIWWKNPSPFYELFVKIELFEISLKK